ncbi:MAG: hypothetical protein Q7T97_02350 [Burkholderiaceae bacterium]|nr:hypothetical protein [Burkholderiaceae bacterium]
MEAIAERLKQIESMDLSSGDHEDMAHGMCVMEATSFVAGEPWSDAPQCACPVITAFLVSWNDSLPDAYRTRLLKPLVPLIVGTRSTKEVEARRSYMALDWLIRVFTPRWLDMVPALHKHAKELRELDAIADMAGAAAAGVKVNAAWDAARAAARAAVWAAAGDAAWDAAWYAAGAAAGAAARAAARDAARDAAWDAAGDVLKPTTEWLQASALNLVHQMIEVRP